MTASTTARATPPTSPTPTAPPTPRERLRRLRFPLAVAAVVVVVAGLVALATPGSRGGDLDPESGGPDGSRALARILDRQGVSVRRVQDPRDAAGETGTVVLVHGELLSPSQLGSLGSAGARLVLVQPDAVVLDALAPPVDPAGSAAASVRSPGCDLPEAQAGPARAGGSLYTLAGATAGTVCFPGGDRPRTGSLVVPGGGARDVVVLGQAEVLTNAHLDEDANAALALRLLGRSASLTWIVPDPLATAPDGEQSLGSLLPPWTRWVVLQAALALLVALLRWAFGRSRPAVARRAQAGHPWEYGLLVSVAAPATDDEGEALRRRLWEHGVRSTVAVTQDGPRLFVFRDDERRARARVERAVAAVAVEAHG
jgi:hypothetical protein